MWSLLCANQNIISIIINNNIYNNNNIIIWLIHIQMEKFFLFLFLFFKCHHSMYDFFYIYIQYVGHRVPAKIKPVHPHSTVVKGALTGRLVAGAEPNFSQTP